ncbi:prepilin-type N-terminal cleavage/methylation domain-containing protein [Aliidiomarina sp.]|uniref:prepilin-type N-terminal cleavage/methylation domain-containing protein n=1 Tax=Aliidiomarina sp. TaxID=1872439 RepID=UPI003A4DED90
MIVVLLVLVNLTTLVLLNALSDSAHSWRLGQHDIQLARAERVATSAATLAQHRYMNYQPTLTNVSFSSGFDALFSYLEQPCPEEKTEEEIAESDTDPTQECTAVTIAVARQHSQNSPNTLQAIRVQRSFLLQRHGGFTLPEVMLALLLLTITLPALSQLLGQVGSYWPRINAAYQEEQRTQNWLAEWQQTPTATKQSGYFVDGREWQIIPQNGLYFWQVSASAVSAAEQGWYLL